MGVTELIFEVRRVEDHSLLLRVSVYPQKSAYEPSGRLGRNLSWFP